MIEGQINMRDYARDMLSLKTEKKSYELGEETATMLVRPRGWHLEEAGITVDGKPMSASLVDFGLHFFHNGKLLAESGRGPFYYLPKIESYQEARLWNDVFNFVQAVRDVPNGTIKVTVLIETLPAAFQMDEILYVLRRHITGLNCGRWDYIFSYIKTLRNHKQFLLPDRAQVGMDRDFLSAYASRLVETCHKRRAHAMGGMAAQIPVKNDEEANKAAFEKVRKDKEREAKLGHDGTWVAHPDLVAVATEVFDVEMSSKHQIHKKRQFPRISDEAMLSPHSGSVTEAGVRHGSAGAARCQFTTLWKMRRQRKFPVVKFGNGSLMVPMSKWKQVSKKRFLVAFMTVSSMKKLPNLNLNLAMTATKMVASQKRPKFSPRQRQLKFYLNS